MKKETLQRKLRLSPFARLATAKTRLKLFNFLKDLSLFALPLQASKSGLSSCFNLGSQYQENDRMLVSSAGCSFNNIAQVTLQLKNILMQGKNYFYFSDFIA